MIFRGVWYSVSLTNVNTQTHTPEVAPIRCERFNCSLYTKKGDTTRIRYNHYPSLVAFHLHSFLSSKLCCSPPSTDMWPEYIMMPRSIAIQRSVCFAFSLVRLKQHVYTKPASDGGGCVLHISILRHTEKEKNKYANPTLLSRLNETRSRGRKNSSQSWHNKHTTW